MTLSPGNRLGPYEILAVAGAGGMGEVYRARDTRLDRTVALKILPQNVAATSEVRMRFEREARAVSSLNHPNICTLYDIGHQDGTDFLVMEFVEGETLAKRIERGALPMPDLLRIAVQVCEALEKAHRQGVIHRDLKPGNIMLTKAGAKLLDFGLAKAAAPVLKDTASSPTMTQPLLESGQGPALTAQGVIVGTLQYMSPEQLEGKEADARSDIFSFGVVLYEMATGKSPFDSRSQASLIASILKEEPRPIGQLQPISSPALERVVTTCLAKDPDDRWQSAGDLKRELQWISASGSQPAIPPPAAVQTKTARSFPSSLLTVVLGVLALAGMAGSVYFARKSSQPSLALQADINPPPGYLFGRPGLNNQFVISPDGSAIAFVAEGEGKWRVFVRNLSSEKAVPLQGTEGAAYPFWSADSKNIGFFSDGKLRRVPAAGGVVQVICDAANGRGGTWSAAGMIVFAPSISGPLFKVSENGGSPEQATRPPKEGKSDRWPVFLPDGRHFLFSGESNILLGSLDSQDFKVLLNRDTNATYANGHLLYFADGNLVAQPFNLSSAKLEGAPVPLFANIEFDFGKSLGNFSVSQTGALVYRTKFSQKYQILWLDRSGKELSKLGDPDYYFAPSLSPDGKQIAVIRSSLDSARRELWIMDASRATFSRALFDNVDVLMSAWSPDGKSLAISLLKNWELRSVSLQNGSSEKLLDADGTSKWPAFWTPDGQTLALTVQNASTNMDVMTLPLAGNRKPIPEIQTPANEYAIAISPDGKLLAYTSNESGRLELYVCQFAGPTQRWQVSNQGASLQPRAAEWSRDGKSLYYIDAAGRLVAVPVQNAPFQVGAPQIIYSQAGAGLGSVSTAPDGRILVAAEVGGQPTPPASLVLNWPSQLSK